MRVLTCLCVAGRLRHASHPTATCGMPLREMLVHCGSLLHEMVFLEVIIKYFDVEYIYGFVMLGVCTASR